MGNSTISPGRYRHYKGNEYQVLAVATHSETLEPMVVYQAEYGDRKIWVRPASMWNEMVTKDGVTAPRFTRISEPEVSMEAKRAVELINRIIDRMIDDAGGHSREALAQLIELGFTREELVDEFQFPSADVDDLMSECESGSEDE